MRREHPTPSGPGQGSPIGQRGECWTSTPDELLYDNGGWDGYSSLASERRTFIPRASTADDFVVPDGRRWLLEAVWVQVTLYPDVPVIDAADVEVFAPRDEGGPDDAALIAAQHDLPLQATFLSECSGHFFRNYEFQIGLAEPVVLDPGRYFLVVRGVGLGPDEGQRCFWNTTRNGLIRWDRGWFRSEYFGFPEWTPVDDERILGVPTDFAFRLLGEVQAVPGDFDGDGDVDIADFSFFSTCFGGSGVPCAENCCAADLDSDGDVDIADFAIFSANFTGSQ